MAIRFEGKQVTEYRRVAVGASCDNCGKEMGPALEDMYEQPLGALHIRLSGGFGQFIDGDASAIWCNNCARKLLEVFPSLEKAIQEV